MKAQQNKGSATSSFRCAAGSQMGVLEQLVLYDRAKQVSVTVVVLQATSR